MQWAFEMAIVYNIRSRGEPVCIQQNMRRTLSRGQAAKLEIGVHKDNSEIQCVCKMKVCFGSHIIVEVFGL